MVRSFAFAAGKTNSFSSSFHVQADNCKLLIHSVINGENDFDYHEYYSEGTNCIIVIKYQDRLVSNVFQGDLGKLTERKLENPAPARNNGTVLVQPDVLPPYGFEYLTIVWLAYGARCYYRESGQGQVPPVVEIGPGFREHNKMTKSIWELDDSPPWMLRSLVEFSDGKQYNLNGSRLIVKDWPMPYRAGFTNAIFAVTASTNIAGLKFPSRFQLLKYSPDLSEPGGNLSVAYMCDAIAENFYVETTHHFSANVPSRSHVIDREINNPNTPYTYYTTNGSILLRQEVEARILQGVKPRKKPFRVNLSVTCGLLFLFGGSFLLLILKILSTRRVR